MNELLPTYIGKCCREWVLAAFHPPGRCGLCGQRPEYLREDPESPYVIKEEAA